MVGQAEHDVSRVTTYKFTLGGIDRAWQTASGVTSQLPHGARGCHEGSWWNLRSELNVNARRRSQIPLNLEGDPGKHDGCKPDTGSKRHFADEGLAANLLELSGEVFNVRAKVGESR